MASLPVSIILKKSQVSPPPATISNRSLLLTFFDIFHLERPPINFLLFYELPISTVQFTETIVPSLKHSLSVTLQHFFPYAGNVIVYPDRSEKPEIRYVDGDSVNVTFAECNLDFHHLTGYHPRICSEFYHLIPSLGDSCPKISNFVKIRVFSLQVTIFPSCGISIGMSIHHSLGDASTMFSFLKAWTSIARCGTDESFLAKGTLPIYERLIKYPKHDEFLLERIKLEAFNQENYQLPKLSGPTDKVRATFILTRSFINKLKTWVSTKLPTLPHVSSFTVACAFIWCCLAHSRNDQRLAFYIPTNCRARMDPPVPEAYFGNCVKGFGVIANTTLLKGKEGLITAAKLIGENLHKFVMDKDAMLGLRSPWQGVLTDGILPTIVSVTGTPKLKFYDLDFGWGKPKKLERISLDYGTSISMDAGKDSDQDLEIGVCLPTTQMEAFVRVFNLGLEPYI